MEPREVYGIRRISTILSGAFSADSTDRQLTFIERTQEFQYGTGVQPPFDKDSVMSNASDESPASANEQDDRFPSGPWEGYFLQATSVNRNKMELHLTFCEGSFTGEGRDFVGPFVCTGKYDCDSGRCWWHKQYLGQHTVFYHGYGEGRGIWGVWEMSPVWKGGFHIWPVGHGSGEAEIAREAVDTPVLIGTEFPSLIEMSAPAISAGRPCAAIPESSGSRGRKALAEPGISGDSLISPPATKPWF